MDNQPNTPVYGPTNPRTPNDGIRRIGSAIALRPEKEAEYRKLHADVWRDVLEALTRSGIRNYVIYIGEMCGKKILFSSFEYHGADYDADMARIAADPVTREWWALTDPCQERLPGAKKDEQWRQLEPVFVLP